MATEQDETFELKLVGPGISVAKQVDRLVALNVLRVVLGGEPPSSPNHTDGDIGATGPILSLREFLDSVGAKTKVAQIVAISAYVHEVLKQKDVSRDQIRAQFSEAAEPMPANFPRDFAKALRAGWLAPTHTNKDRFYVTQSGRSALKRGIEA